MALELDSRYPGRFNPGDADYPQGSFKNRTAPGALDGSYLEQDWANDKEGFFQRLMAQAGLTANGEVDTALASQYYDALLQVIADNAAADPLNAAIATVAAASTINLTTGAPDTSQLVISGTGATINGFTVAANRFFVVKMTGASNVLVDSASLVTGRGSNITAVSGDTFLMRATAANTVEILCYVSRGIRLGTAQSPLSGTSVDFVGIPPGASRITVMLSGVSTNGGSSIQVQLGSGSIETTGYNGAAEINAASTANTTGLQVNRGQDAASLTTGSATLNRIDGNRWIISGTFWLDNVNRVGYVAGGKTVVAGAIDRIRVTTVNGTDTFDAGTANISWEIGG